MVQFIYIIRKCIELKHEVLIHGYIIRKNNCDTFFLLSKVNSIRKLRHDIFIIFDRILPIFYTLVCIFSCFSFSLIACLLKLTGIDDLFLWYIYICNKHKFNKNSRNENQKKK